MNNLQVEDKANFIVTCLPPYFVHQDNHLNKYQKTFLSQYQSQSTYQTKSGRVRDRVGVSHTIRDWG